MDRIEKAYAVYRAEEPMSKGETTEMEDALRSCVESLPEGSRRLLVERYTNGASIRQLAVSSAVSEDGLKMRLLRLRQKLAACVRSRLSRETHIHDSSE
jgi:DNA-directed RNA polymerase specialized sigma24 family protein